MKEKAAEEPNGKRVYDELHLLNPTKLETHKPRNSKLNYVEKVRNYT